MNSKDTCPACGQEMADAREHYNNCHSNHELHEKIMQYLGVRCPDLRGNTRGKWLWCTSEPLVIKAWQGATESKRKRWLVQQALLGELHARAIGDEL